MMPLIQPGDHLLLAVCENEKPRVGELIAWSGGGVTVVHRLAGFASDGWVVEAGDAGLVFARRRSGQVFARVAAVAPEQKAPWVFIGRRNPAGLVMHLAWKKILPGKRARFLIRHIDRITRRIWQMKQKKTTAAARTPVVQEVGEELMVYDPSTGDVHTLNRTARIVWRMAEKGESEGAICDHFRKSYPDAPEDMEQYVRPVLDIYRRVNQGSGR